MAAVKEVRPESATKEQEPAAFPASTVDGKIVTLLEGILPTYHIFGLAHFNAKDSLFLTALKIALYEVRIAFEWEIVIPALVFIHTLFIVKLAVALIVLPTAITYYDDWQKSKGNMAAQERSSYITNFSAQSIFSPEAKEKKAEAEKTNGLDILNGLLPTRHLFGLKHFSNDPKEKGEKTIASIALYAIRLYVEIQVILPVLLVAIYCATPLVTLTLLPTLVTAYQNRQKSQSIPQAKVSEVMRYLSLQHLCHFSPKEEQNASQY